MANKIKSNLHTNQSIPFDHSQRQALVVRRSPTHCHSLGSPDISASLVARQLKIDFPQIIYILFKQVKILSFWDSTYLTPWELVYDIFIPGNRLKTSSLRLPYQRHSSFADCAKELFKPSKNLASLLVCDEKCIFG